MNKPAAAGFHVVRGGAEGVDPGALAGAVVAIGNFDGVHRGHRAVIGAARARAEKLGRKTAAMTFTPHPRLFLRPQDTLFQLSSERDKLRLLAATGLDGAIVMTFDAALAATSAEDFIERILVGRLGIGGAAIGFDFHFGKNRTGSPEFLAAQGKKFGFPVDIVPPLEDEGRPVSSGAVRTALSRGEVVEAAELLGAPWSMSGEVVHGDKRGRKLGFPTVNLRLDPACGLKHGIYAVRVGVPNSVRSRALAAAKPKRLGFGEAGSGNPGAAGADVAGSPLSAFALGASADSKRAEAREASGGGSRGRTVELFDGVASVGRRPMFETGEALLEVFLFDFDGDLYGELIDVAFIGWIRHAQKFESIEALQAAMMADAIQARDALARAGDAFPALGEI
jgi:riboflavin kinase/FMN adenylyltransferase